MCFSCRSGVGSSPQHLALLATTSPQAAPLSLGAGAELHPYWPTFEHVWLSPGCGNVKQGCEPVSIHVRCVCAYVEIFVWTVLKKYREGC